MRNFHQFIKYLHQRVLNVVYVILEVYFPLFLVHFHYDKSIFKVVIDWILPLFLDYFFEHPNLLLN